MLGKVTQNDASARPWKSRGRPSILWNGIQSGMKLIMQLPEYTSHARSTVEWFAGEPLYDVFGRPIRAIPSLWMDIADGRATYTSDPKLISVNGELVLVPENTAIVSDGAVCMYPDHWDTSKEEFTQVLKKTDKIWFVTTQF